MRKSIPQSHPLEEVRVRQLQDGTKFLASLTPDLRRVVADECCGGEIELELRQRHGAWTIEGSVPEFRWFRAAWVVAIAASIVSSEMLKRDAARATLSARMIALVWGGGVHTYIELGEIARSLREETALPWNRAEEVWAAFVEALGKGVISPPSLKVGRTVKIRGGAMSVDSVYVLRS